MSCSSCGCNNCGCSIPTGCNVCNCVDNGSLTAGRHAVVLDYQLCQKRLVNSSGFLVNVVNESGTATIQWSGSPCVELPELVLSEGVEIDNIIAALGDSFCWHNIVPDPTASGVLTAQNGKWIIGDIPTANIPDPLTVENLIVNDTATILDISVTGGICFTAIAEGAVTQTIGLDVNNCIVKNNGASGTPLGISVALYYENSAEIATDTPNLGITNGQYATIGNEIADSNNISSVVAVDQIKIDIAGQYMIQWYGVYDAASQRVCNLNLVLNGGTDIPGEGNGYTHSGSGNQTTYPVTGITVRTLAVNDTIKLKCYSTGSGANNLNKVKLILTRFGA